MTTRNDASASVIREEAERRIDDALRKGRDCFHNAMIEALATFDMRDGAVVELTATPIAAADEAPRRWFDPETGAPISLGVKVRPLSSQIGTVAAAGGAFRTLVELRPGPSSDPDGR